MNERQEILLQEIAYYFNRKQKVHIELLGRRFYNGIITEYDEEKLILLDHKTKSTIPIFIRLIKIVEPYMERTNYDKNS